MEPVKDARRADEALAEDSAARGGVPPVIDGVDLVISDIIGEGEVAYALDLVVVDTPGITKEVLTAVYSLGGNVVKIHGYRLLGGGKGRLLVIATYNGQVRESDIARALASVEGVLEYRVYGPYVGPAIVAPPFAGYLTSPPGTGGGRLLVLRASTLQYLIDTLYWTLPQTSRPLGLQILYMLGRFMGGYAKTLAERVSRGGAGEYLRASLDVLRAGGWILDFTLHGEGGEVLRIAFKGYWLRPIQTGEGAYLDPFTAGVLEEILEGAWGGSWHVSLEEYEPGSREDSVDAKHVYRAERMG